MSLLYFPANQSGAGERKMGSEPKTRVVVGYEGVDRALFSVRQNRNSGDLTILMQNARNFEDEEAGSKNIEIRRHKLSIHGSPNSAGTTITREFCLADGRRITSAQFIKDSKESLFCLVYSMLLPDLGEAHYLSKPRARDSLARIGQFNRADMASLIYHIVVANHDVLMPFVLGHSILVLDFDRWKIGIYSTYVNFPADVFGHFNVPLTRPSATNGVPNSGFPAEFASSDGGESLPGDQLSGTLKYVDNLLSAKTMIKRCSLLLESQRAPLMQHQFNFHPTVDSLFAERLGVPQGQRVTYEHLPMLNVLVRKT
ncbi:hypothetical protein ABID59_005463 [Bradyrhizobium sp. S3.3.6]|uniref:hypothetical protein n=1 Tax=Bradyrhizobium sp. S3.3.6 TaxID=3156429 RepID=UPI003391BA4B